jgi:glycosyltransferase involved in cell wall biosynthesis
VIETVFAIPGDIGLATGGYMYARRVIALLPDAGIAVKVLQLPDAFPHPDAADLDRAERLLAAVAPTTSILADGLAFGAIPAKHLKSVRSPIVALVHHPLCLETGLTDRRKQELRELETRSLALACRIITTSELTARTLTWDFAVPESKITVAKPGTDPAARTRGSGNPTLQLLTIGSIVPRKAHATLVRALAPLKDLDWHLTLVGPTDRSPEALAHLNNALSETGLRPRVTLTGSLPQEKLADFYAHADVFLLPSLYEGYGMVLGDAMAHGLPIICTTGGAAAATAPDSAAIKVPPGEERALTLAIADLLNSASLRQRLADASWAAGQGLPRWEYTARTIARVLEEIAP